MQLFDGVHFNTMFILKSIKMQRLIKREEVVKKIAHYLSRLGSRGGYKSVILKAKDIDTNVFQKHCSGGFNDYILKLFSSHFPVILKCITCRVDSERNFS